MSRPEIVLLGVNHKTAPVEVREKLALKEEEIPPLQLFSELSCCREVVFLSTCNRVEIIACTDNPESLTEVRNLWTGRAGLSREDTEKCLYEYHNLFISHM